ncbi:MAG: (Fe-S)-binding protein [Chlorobiota bacterium]|nr:MAG: (Fe-S)-binding protein [Chlorobiota bacterium]
MLKHIIFWICFITAVVAMLQNVKRLISYLQLGQNENRFNNILTRVKNVLIIAIGQTKLLRDKVAGAVHAMIFWGFLVLLIAVIESIVEGLIPHGNLNWLGPIYSMITVSQDVFCIAIIVGVIWAAIRRLSGNIKRLVVSPSEQRDAMIILTLIFVIVTSLFLTNASRLGANEEYSWAIRPISGLLHPLFTNGNFSKIVFETSWWLHILVIFGFMNYLPHSKHLHVITSIPNVYFSNLGTVNKLEKIDFEQVGLEKFGKGDIEDFTWKQLLDGMTCTHCGRCSTVCPANSTGKILDPKEIIIGLNNRTMDKAPQVLRSKGVQDIPGVDDPSIFEKVLIGDYISNEALWQCTTCMACVQECPVMIEHVPAIIDMRRWQVMMQSDFPVQLQPAFQNIENNFTPWAFSNSERSDWTQGTKVKSMESATKNEIENLDVLFWVGCAGSYDDRYKKVTKAFAEIMDIAEVNYRILGTEEKCTGDPARRAGNEYLASSMIQMNVETLNNYNVKKIVTSCPHCFNTLLNEYPDFGGKYEVIHHTAFIEDLIKEGRIKGLNEMQAKVTFHDSCYLGRYNNTYEPPRALINNIPGLEIIEMPRNKDKGFCCGAGGAQMFMEETEGKRINIERTEEALSTGAQVIASACPFCMTMMSDGVKTLANDSGILVKDVAELVLEAIHK